MASVLCPLTFMAWARSTRDPLGLQFPHRRGSRVRREVGRLAARAAVGPVRVHPLAEATVLGRALLCQGQLIRSEREAEAAGPEEQLPLIDRIVARHDHPPRSSAHLN